MSAAQKLKVIAELYQKQLPVYEQMVMLGERNTQLVEEDKIAQLLAGLDEYSKLMEEVDAISAQIKSAQDEVKSELGLEEFSLEELAEASRKVPEIAGAVTELTEIFSRLETVLQKLLELTQRGASQLEVKVKNVGHSVTKVRKGRQAAKAYGLRPYVPGTHFLDKKR